MLIRKVPIVCAYILSHNLFIYILTLSHLSLIADLNGCPGLP